MPGNDYAGGEAATTAAATPEQKSSKNTYTAPSTVFLVFTPSQGLDFLLSHFSCPEFPRTIMTPKVKQKEVYSKEHAPVFYKEVKRKIKNNYDVVV